MTLRRDADAATAATGRPMSRAVTVLGNAWTSVALSLHRWKGAIWVLGFVIAFGLGVRGWAQVDEQHNAATYVNDAFRTIQLLTLRGQGVMSAKLPWELNVARFLLPVLALLGSYRLLIASIRSPARLATLGLRHGHVVVVPGRGGTGQALLEEVRAGGLRAVAIVPGLKVEDRARIEESGLAVLSADPFLDSTWHQARADRAALIVVASGNDVENLNITVTVAEALRRRKEPGGPMLVMALDDGSLAEQVDVALDTAARNSRLRYRRLSVPEQAARVLFLEPPLPTFKRDRADRSHIVILGLGAGARAVLYRALTLGQDAASAGPRISILASEKELGAEPLLRPDVVPGYVAELCSVRCDWSGGLPLDTLASLMEQDPPVTLCCVCMGDDAAIATGIALARQATLHGWPDFPIAIHQQREDRFLGLLARESTIAGHARLRPFGGLLPQGTLQHLMNERQVSLAQAIHEDYVDSQQRKNASDGMQNSWDSLPENFRHANRAAADHYPVKLAAIGCDIVDGTAPPFAFTDAEVEALACIEHRRWSAERLLLGWRLGARNDDRRLHPDLVPFEELTEAGRDKDRDAVRSMPAVLARAGKSIRRAAAPAPASAAPAESPATAAMADS